MGKNEPAQKIPIYFVRPLTESMQILLSQYSADPEIEAIGIPSAKLAANVVAKKKYGVVIASASSQEQMVKVLTMLKVFRPLIASRLLKVVICSGFREKKINVLFDKHGASEVLIEPLKYRTLELKVGRWVKNIGARLKAVGQKKSRRPGQAQESLPGGAARVEAKFQWGEPLDFESDCWAVPRGETPIKSMGRWTVRLEGPPPAAGRWRQVHPSQSTSEKDWHWFPEDPEDQSFVKDTGVWAFYGIKPEFRQGSWIFQGETPLLGFVNGVDFLHSRIHVTDDGVLLVSANSKAGLTAQKKAQKDLLTIKKIKPVAPPPGSKNLGEDEDLLVDEVKVDAPAEALPDLEFDGDVEARIAEKKMEEEAPTPEVFSNEAPVEDQETEGLIDRIELPGVNSFDATPASETEKGVEMLVDPDDPNGRVVRIRTEVFGRPPGEWLYVGVGPKMARWYFYVSPDLAEGKVEDPESGVPFWVFEGNGIPILGPKAAYWRFKQSEPLKFDQLDDLPRAVQFQVQVLIDGGLKAWKAVKNDGGGFETAAAKFGRKEAAQAPESGTDSKEETEEVELNFTERVRNRFIEQGKEPSAAMSATLNKVGETLAAKGMGDVAELLSTGASNQSLDLIRAAKVPGPSLSPLALAFLMSELSVKRSVSLARISERFCAFLSASLGGLRVELWIKEPKGKKWKCASSSDGTAAGFEKELKKAMPRNGFKEGELKGGNYFSPVMVQGENVATIVVSGDGTPLISPTYLAAVAQSAIGLASTLYQQGFDFMAGDQIADGVTSVAA